jgi:hypothetical protein
MSAETWTPVSDEDAASLIGEGLHTGFRKGTDAPESAGLWQAIDRSDRAWPEALAFLISGLKSMGYQLCERDEART